MSWNRATMYSKLRFCFKQVQLLAPFVVLVSCARFEPRTLSPLVGEMDLEGRSLTNQALQSFVALNLSRPLTNWSGHDWDLDTLTLAAFYYQPSLELARAQWATAQGGGLTAAQRPNPTLTVTPGYNTTPSSLSPWFPLTFLDITLETAGKRRYRIAQSAQLSEAARLNLFVVAWQVRSGIHSNLIDYASAVERTALLKQQLDLQEQLLKMLDDQVKAGAISSSEATPFRIALQKLYVDSMDARRQELIARAGLAESIGVPADAFAGMKINFNLMVEPYPGAVLTREEARKLALVGRADILEALAEYQAAQAALQLQIAKQYPDVHLQPGYQFDQGDNKWSLGVVAELPILNQNQGPIAEAQARRQEAAARFTLVQARVLAEVDRAIDALEAGRQNVEQLRQLLEQQARRRDAAEAQVKAGAAAQVDLLNAEFEYTTVQTLQLEGRIKLRQALAGLEAAVQQPLHLTHSIVLTNRINP